MILSREAILNAKDLETETVDVPEWGGSVIVKTMTGDERDEFEASYTQLPENMRLHQFRARVAARCIVDEDGVPLFSSADLDALGRKSGAALGRVFDVAARLNGLTKKDEAELVGNSDPDPSAG